MKSFPEDWLARHLQGGEPDTRLLYNGKVRGSAEIRHMIYNFGEEADVDILTPGVAFRPKKLANIHYPTENGDDDGDDESVVLQNSCPEVTNVRNYLVDKHNKEWVTTSKICEHFTLRDEISKAVLLSRMFGLLRAERLECKETRTGCFSWRVGCLKPE